MVKTRSSGTFWSGCLSRSIDASAIPSEQSDQALPHPTLPLHALISTTVWHRFPEFTPYRKAALWWWAGLCHRQRHAFSD